MATASNILEALGLVAVVVGVYFFDWRAAVVVAGVLAVVVGFALDGAGRQPAVPALGEREIR